MRYQVVATSLLHCLLHCLLYCLLHCLLHCPLHCQLHCLHVWFACLLLFREYGETLQCFHLALHDCQPKNLHFMYIAQHLGQVKAFMDEVCAAAKQLTSPTITPTTDTTTTMAGLSSAATSVPGAPTTVQGAPTAAEVRHTTQSENRTKRLVKLFLASSRKSASAAGRRDCRQLEAVGHPQHLQPASHNMATPLSSRITVVPWTLLSTLQCIYVRLS